MTLSLITFFFLQWTTLQPLEPYSFWLGVQVHFVYRCIGPGALFTASAEPFEGQGGHRQVFHTAPPEGVLTVTCLA